MSLILRYVQLKREIDKAQEELDAIAAEIKGKGVATYELEHHTVKVSSVAGRTTTDWKGVVRQADVPQDVIDAHTKIGAPTLRITIQ